MRPASRLRPIFAALLAAPLLAAAQAPEPLFNLVTLDAQAEREVPNDLLSAVLATEQEGADPSQLADAANRTMQRALAIAKGYAGVKARSGNYQTTPIYDKSRIVRWRLRQELRLESGDFAAASELIGKLQASLVVSGLTLSVSTQARRQAENALIAEALAAFEERARLVSEVMKSKGYRVRDLQISGGGPPRPVFAAAARAMSSAPVAPPAFEPGTTHVLMSVSGTIQLQ